MRQEDQQSHLQLQIDCPFYCMTMFDQVIFYKKHV